MLRTVLRVLRRFQDTTIVLYGQWRIDKTSILQHLAVWLPREGPYHPSYFRLQDKADWSLDRVLQNLVRTIAHTLGYRDPDLSPDPETAFRQEWLPVILDNLPEGSSLVLLFDEFDVLLYHPILNSAEFFGSLRSLASRSRGALALVIASRRPLTSLNEATQQFSRTGSPYFNFLGEITLGPWPDKDVAELLRRAGDRFTTDDRHFIAEVAGGHPYLLQVAAYELWEAYEEGQRDPNRRRQQAGRKLYDEAARILGDTWRLWSPAARRAFTTVALAHIPGKSRLYMERLVRDMPDLELELRALAKRGFVAEDETVPSGWRVRSSAFLWWLADELVRTVRDEPSFEEWLRAQGWEGLLTRSEKQQLGKGVRAVGGMLKDGAKTLIEAAAKGTVETVFKGG